MKYLENAALEKISNFLSFVSLGDRVLEGRLETFSCKRAGDDKKLSKVLEAKIVEGLSCNSARSRKRSSSLGDLSSVSTRRLLIDLISTLNASFPDYDFSSLSPESFNPEDVTSVVQRVNSYLAEVTASNPDFLVNLWRTMDEVVFIIVFIFSWTLLAILKSMQIKRCEVYSYVPDMDEDPFSNGAL